MVNMLYVCRHGETSWNAERRIQGRTDIGLNEAGFRQAAILADYFRNAHPEVERVVSSPMLRAVQTAQATAEALGLALEVDEDLTEIHTGIFTAKTLDSLKDDPRWQAHLLDPWREGYGEGGESAESVRARMARVYEKYDRAILFSHASPIRHLLMYLFGIPHEHLYHLTIANAQATCIEKREGFAKLVYMNRN